MDFWDLKDNNKTIFGVAWSFDESRKQVDKDVKNTEFSYNGLKMNAADVGNYHAGYTGTWAGIGTGLQKIGAGIAEISKNGTYSQFLNPRAYTTPPYGDAKNDYHWNTLGILQAKKEVEENKAKTGLPFIGSHISRAVLFGNW